ncbi:hypothetical protein SGPA1_10851 [Streptomyces misionensis JCM 4497]
MTSDWPAREAWSVYAAPHRQRPRLRTAPRGVRPARRGPVPPGPVHHLLRLPGRPGPDHRRAPGPAVRAAHRGQHRPAARLGASHQRGGHHRVRRPGARRPRHRGLRPLALRRRRGAGAR